jgi:serine/threonine-protein kinase
MGQVYEALDLELGEIIAIKTISSQIAESTGSIARFKREVYAARKITHPNVCRTFDLETHTATGAVPGEPQGTVIFLTMELLEGETLAQRIHRAGPLPSDQVHVLATQVALALGAAHGAGIIHCDLKPANIFLTGSDSKLRAVVTDFGIARVNPLYDRTAVSGSGSPAAATLAGEILGTPDYMAPEQFQTRQSTTATDLYSFGLVVYEALTGVRGLSETPTVENVRANLLTASNASEGKRPPIPLEWSVLIANCLQIDPQRRFHNVQQVLDALAEIPGPAYSGAPSGSRRVEWAAEVPSTGSVQSGGKGSGLLWLIVAGAWLVLVVVGMLFHYGKPGFPSRSVSDVRSVAILPLVNRGNDPQAAALSESMADDLTNDLAQVSGIKVPAESAVRDLGKLDDFREVGRQLKVDAVVSGSIAKTPDGFRLDVNLVDATTGAQIWGQSYNSKPADFAALEADIAEEVAFRLQLQADGSAPAKARQAQSTNPAAEAAYQKGEEAMAEHTPEGFARAIDSFQQAIDADPKNADAMAELAHAYSLMAYNYNRPEEPLALLNQAEQTARRALQLDSTSAEAYSSLAEVEVLKDFNWNAAEKDYKRAIELNPGYLPAHVSYALHLLTPLGRFAEARAQYSYAERTPQKSLGAEVSMAISDYYGRQYTASLARLEPMRDSKPAHWVVIAELADNYIAMDEPEKALPLLTSNVFTSDDARSVRDVLLGIATAQSGRKADALRQLQQVENAKQAHLNFPIATLLAALGYKDKAVDYLEKAAANRESDILFVGVDPMLDSLRSNPRLQALENKLNLTPHQENVQ